MPTYDYPMNHIDHRVNTRSTTVGDAPVRVAEYDPSRIFACLYLGFHATNTYRIGRTAAEAAIAPKLSLQYLPYIKVYGSDEIWVAPGVSSQSPALYLQVALVCGR